MDSDDTPPDAGLRAIPSIDRLLAGFDDSIERFGHQASVAALRNAVQDARDAIVSGSAAAISEDSIRQAARVRLEDGAEPRLRRVYNLSGTVLHTNLGRAVLPAAAIDAVVGVAGGYSNLEFDLASGRRGNREAEIEDLVRELTGAEAATVVNNNAAAVLLVLNTLAMHREVPVSRGELVEIGGSFRIPEVMQRANCTLVEVGATNRTHLGDYRAAIGERTALLMKVHTSNYRIEGFASEVAIGELAGLARERDLPLVMDLGSGSLVHFARYGLPHEPTAAEVLEEGADLITFSGDKLLGGPQCGLVAGRADLVERIRANPLKRALRLDKMTIAALVEVLKLYRNPDGLVEALPTLRHLVRSSGDIREQALRLEPAVKKAVGDNYRVEVVDVASQVGSGSLPVETIPSSAIAISATDEDRSQQIAAAFRKLPIPVIGHISKSRFLMDLRCLDDDAAFLSQLGLLQV